MPPIRLIQPSFSSGEVSPSIWHRTDINKYQTSLRTLRNFIVHPTGGVSNRPGTRYVADAKFSDAQCIVQEFIFNQEQKYVLEIGDKYTRFYRNGAQISKTTDTGLTAIPDNTKILVHFDGTDASTTFTDESGEGHTLTAVGNAQVDTAQSKFGGASGLFDGTGDYISVADADDLDLGGNNFYIAAWVRRANTTGNHIICGRVTSSTSYFYFGFEGTNMRFRDFHANANVINISQSVTMNADQWYHVAVSRLGSSIKLWLDGVQQGSTTSTGAFLTDRAAALTIGAMTDNATYVMNGHIDEFIYVNGSAVETAAFTPPTAAYGETTETEVYEITTPWAEDDLDDLRFETSGDTIFVTHPDYQPRLLQRFGETDWRVSKYECDDGPFMPENTDESISLSVAAVTGSVSLSAASSYFVSGHVGALFKLRHYIEGQEVSTSFTSATTSSSIKCFTTWRLISHGTWTGKFRVEKSTDGGSTWTTLRTFSSSNDFNANTSGTEDVETNEVPFLIRINFYSYTSGTANIDLTTDPFYQDGIVRITAVHSGISATATVLQEVGSTDNTISWAEGSWSDYRGWPAVSRFYQDRLVFAATDAEPMTLWMTQTGNYFSFKRHSPLLDTDGISTNIPSRQLNAINGLVAFKRLLVFTSASIWSVGPVSGSTMTPTGFTQEIEEYNGSNGINPVVIGNEAIYIQEHGHIVSNIGFELASDSFQGADANILAQHLFDKWTIDDIAYQRNPDRIVWMLRSDGKLVGMTYLRDQEVVAFHWHDTGQDTGDQFESLCVIPADGFDEVWFVVNRKNGRLIERMVLRMEGVECGGEVEITAQNQMFMDSAVEYNDEAEITSITVAYDDYYVITAPDHGFSDGDTVRLGNVSGVPTLSHRTFVIGNVSEDTFDLISEVV